MMQTDDKVNDNILGDLIHKNKVFTEAKKNHI
jgi:hypothetical protein